MRIETRKGGIMVDPLRHVEEAVEFAENPEPRCPCVLLLDISKSMRGEAIKALNEGLVTFHTDLSKDPLATRRVEIAIVTFGHDVEVVHNFLPVDRFTPPVLVAAGLTPMGTAINKALDLLEERKRVYKSHGVAYYRPWVFMITDGKPKGEPDEAMELAVHRLREQADVLGRCSTAAPDDVQQAAGSELGDRLGHVLGRVVVTAESVR